MYASIVFSVTDDEKTVRIRFIWPFERNADEHRIYFIGDIWWTQCDNVSREWSDNIGLTSCLTADSVGTRLKLPIRSAVGTTVRKTRTDCWSVTFDIRRYDLRINKSVKKPRPAWVTIGRSGRVVRDARTRCSVARESGTGDFVFTGRKNIQSVRRRSSPLSSTPPHRAGVAPRKRKNEIIE